MVSKRSSGTATQIPDRHHSCTKGWWLETAGLVVSIISQAAIAIVLGNIDGMVLSSWMLGLSPNTVVSTLSTVAKTAMLFTVSECIGQAKWLRIGRVSAEYVGYIGFLWKALF